MIKAWLQFTNERFPLPVYLLLSCGFAISASLFKEGQWQSFPIIAVIFGVMLFFFTLRVMDECKDYDKDCIAHKDRPLPRGLLPLNHVKKAIYGLMLAMIFFVVTLHPMFGLWASIIYLFITFYLFCMYKEFFIGPTLSSYPLCYAFTHQVILFPLVFFALSLVEPLHDQLTEKTLYAAMVFFSFFAYEIARKLDPKAPQILGTYLIISGRQKTMVALSILLLASALCAVALFHNFYLLPFVVTIFFTLIMFIKKPALHKLVELSASISLLLHIWSVSLWRLLQ